MDTMGLLVVVGLLVAGCAALETRLSRVDRRIARVERRLDVLLSHLGVPDQDQDPDLERVRDLVRADRRVEAIKAYREATGAGLREAKEAVDRLG
ncbi:hypothetical protein ACFOOM_22515 [Streptomyces echinoruber]|uniref:Ribosomal protein L7/L12 C-terminal domain-containing protein n=1 Tax=Streptomyces echinoruber TaxID=68898 RepID=A0A918V9D9_9ACTN|nr:hypothetical protein [Streptomyces echinoruber]GGZ82402.1 hypothetical protein GCM10010389_20460 [Streptomyces echinoruber]